MNKFTAYGRQIRRQIVSRYYRISIKQRILFSFIVLITLSISAMGSFSYWIAAQEIEDNAYAGSQETVSKTAQLLDSRLNDVALSVQSLMLSDAYRKMMLDVFSHDVSNYYVHLSDLQYVLSQATFNQPIIENVLIVTPIGDFYSTTQTRAQDHSFYDSELYGLSKGKPGGYWAKGHYDRLFTGSQRVVSFVVRGIYEYPYTPISNVFIVVNIRESRINELLNKGGQQAGWDYYLVSGEGEAVVESHWPFQGRFPWKPMLAGAGTAAGPKDYNYSYGGKEYLVNYTGSAASPNWIISGMQSRDQLLGKLQRVQRITLYVIAFFLLATWLISNQLTSVLLKPLFKLRRLMRRVEENQLSVVYESRYEDEVAQVGYQFNRMMSEIKVLIADVKAKEEDKRHAEIRALTAQMEPHFLYNTLNTIYCKSVMGENDDVNEMILSLSQMFQIGLSGGKDLIPLEDELSHMQQYFAIQQKCYEGLFEYTVTVEDEALLSCLLPKIILQPVVENSIQHGFSDRTAGGRIDITVSREQELLHICITDNGRGLDAARVKQGMVRAPQSRKGYALFNIRHRLALYYGAEARMDVGGEPCKGSRTDLWIPLGEER
ncbi:sensor histidine kinase [Paenibacillus sp. FSL L8-0323]|uniref:cache domain-containing sensor histidine kinase n=1 Tax=Paenibacillus TaxID=44249 RepID=UPI00096C350C|nr:sensor histidine kinase [Paenibacillus odorifer]OMD10253.1 two-component sensor histidine kinase [Paenibacillus odorifer]OMD20518.1 two-component sensor histidine kinase [Paenibacillus odorifer]